MSKLDISREDSALLLSGDLDKHTVPAALKQARQLILGAGGPIRLDLGAVTRADSAGIAMLLDCMRQARQAGLEVRFQRVPEQMLAIARVSGLDHILPLEDA